MGSKIPQTSHRWIFCLGKTQVYIKKPQNLQQLKDLIAKEANSISKEFFENP